MIRHFCSPRIILLPLVLSGYLFTTGFSGFFTDNQVASILFRLCFCSISFLALYEQLKQYQFNIEVNLVVVFYILFYVFYITRILFDINSSTETKIPASNYIIFSLLLSLIPSIIFLFHFSNDQVRKIQKVTFFLLSLTVIAIFIRFFLDINVIHTDNGRLFLPRTNAISISIVASSAVIVCLSCPTIFGNGAGIKMFKALIIGMAAYLIIASGSRAPFFSLIIIANLIFIFYPFKNMKLKYLLVFIQLFALAFFLYISYSLHGVLFQRILSTGSTSDTSAIERFLLLLNAWHQFQSHPFFGNFIELRDFGVFPHNIILESLMATGILGTGLLIFVLCNALFLSLKMMVEIEHTWIGALLLQNIIYSLYSGALWDNAPLFCLIVLANSLNAKKSKFTISALCSKKLFSNQ